MLIRTIEEVDLSEYEDFGDALRSLGRFLDEVYNRKRIHSSLENLTFRVQIQGRTSLPPPDRSETMDRLRVLLAVKPPLLSSTLRILLAQHPKLNVIDAGIDDVAILVEARQQRVDVVVATFEPTSDVPPLVPLLLVELPEVRVIGIDLRNQCARIYATHSDVRIIPDLTVSGMIDAILSGKAKPGETGED